MSSTARKRAARLIGKRARIAARNVRLLRFAELWLQHRQLRLVAAEMGLCAAAVGRIKAQAIAAGLIAPGKQGDRRYAGKAMRDLPPAEVRAQPGKLLLDDELHELVYGDGRREPAPPGLIWKYDMTRLPGRAPAYELTPRVKELRHA